jgi:predicted nucleic acid-binding protein
MTIFFDTSTLVAAMVATHPAYDAAFPWLQRIQRPDDVGFVATHSLAELYAILTRLPVFPRISPTLAHQLIQQNVLDNCTIVALTQEDYQAVLRHLAENGLIGGITYDALLLYAAIKSRADQVVTLNAKDFRRIYPALKDQIISPLE